MTIFVITYLKFLKLILSWFYLRTKHWSTSFIFSTEIHFLVSKYNNHYSHFSINTGLAITKHKTKHKHLEAKTKHNYKINVQNNTLNKTDNLSGNYVFGIFGTMSLLTQTS